MTSSHRYFFARGEANNLPIHLTNPAALRGRERRGQRFQGYTN
jgi:hypothetical protein